MLGPEHNEGMTTAPADYTGTIVLATRDLRIGDTIVRLGTEDLPEALTVALLHRIDVNTVRIVGTDDAEVIAPAFRNAWVHPSPYFGTAR